MNGDLLALIANAHRDQKKKPIPFSREDFYKITDRQLTQEHDPELFQKVAQRLGGTIKENKRVNE